MSDENNPQNPPSGQARLPNRTPLPPYSGSKQQPPATNPPKPASGSIFGTGSSRPPGAGTTSPSIPGTKPASSFGSVLRSRLGTTGLEWPIVPVMDTLIRFDLNGLGDPFHRLLGKGLAVEYGDFKAVTHALEAGGEAVNALEVRLDEAWQTYNLRGAILFYPWRDDLKRAVISRPTADKPPRTPPREDDDEFFFEDDEDTPNTPIVPACLRAIDLLLVLNVLARTRAQILLATAPLSFEQSYLERSLVTDDPRLVALARATGYVEEALGK